MHGVETVRELQREVTPWRRHLHENPELEYGQYSTVKCVAEKLPSFPINQIETETAESGIPALIQGEYGDGRTIGLRADMDALPILEASHKPWTSKVPGNMHACGHDGHTAMLHSVTINHPEETKLAVKAAQSRASWTRRRGWARKISPTCFRQGRVLLSFLAMDPLRACIIQHTTQRCCLSLWYRLLLNLVEAALAA